MNQKYKITRDRLETLHVSQDHTPQEIAKYYGCSRSLIYHYFKKFNIEKRPKYLRLRGKRFGKLLVKEFIGINDDRNADWLCKCDCGNETIATTTSLRFGTVKSCGCLQKEKAIIHGMSGTRPYRIWLAMKSRCGNTNAWNYENYGGRGIFYCESWKDFINFWHDMKKGYEKDKSLERIDNERGYFPQNCKWAFVEEQNNNKRNSVKLTFKGLTLTVTEWAKRMDATWELL